MERRRRVRMNWVYGVVLVIALLVCAYTLGLGGADPLTSEAAAPAAGKKEYVELVTQGGGTSSATYFRGVQTAYSLLNSEMARTLAPEGMVWFGDTTWKYFKQSQWENMLERKSFSRWDMPPREFHLEGNCLFFATMV